MKRGLNCNVLKIVTVSMIDVVQSLVMSRNWACKSVL